jgi:hypothetical protein
MTHICTSCGQHYHHNCSENRRPTAVLTNFERTLSVLQHNLNLRLREGYTRIWVQGGNKPTGTTLVFTIFTGSRSYQMKFISIRNFRQFRQDSSNIEEEMDFIRRHIDSFRTTLQDFITYE